MFKLALSAASLGLAAAAQCSCTEPAPCLHGNDGTCQMRVNDDGDFVQTGGHCASGTTDCDPVAKPDYPTQYTASVTFSIPYYGTVEEITVWEDDSQQLQRVSYYDGRDIYQQNWSDADDAMSYQLSPAFNEMQCWESGASDPLVIFPDLTDFELQDDQTTVNNVVCNEWKLVQDTADDYGYIGTYSMYVSAEDGTPVQFHTLGHNVVLGGSHYDEYVLDYNSITAGAQDPSVFAIDNPDTCTEMPSDDDRSADDDGGPTQKIEHPIHNFELAFAEHRDLKAEIFADFVNYFGKEYETDGHKAEAFGHFHRAVHYVNAVNHQGRKFTVGVNHMADWSREDRHKLLGHVDDGTPPAVPAAAVYDEVSQDLPANVDWRQKGAVVPVGDQGTCGSCWAWGSVGAAAGQAFLAQTGDDIVPLSAQQLMDCGWEWGSKSCQGSTASKAFSYVLEGNDGVMDTAASYPYENQDGFCRDSQGKAGVTLSSYVNVTGEDFDVFNTALTNIGPLSIAIDATPDSFYFYLGGLYDDADCLNGEDDLDHEVLAVGFETEEDGSVYTLVQNSWSTHWGEDGYVRIAQTGNICGVSDEPVYPVVA